MTFCHKIAQTKKQICHKAGFKEVIDSLYYKTLKLAHKAEKSFRMQLVNFREIISAKEYLRLIFVRSNKAKKHSVLARSNGGKANV